MKKILILISMCFLLSGVNALNYKYETFQSSLHKVFMKENDSVKKGVTFEIQTTKHTQVGQFLSDYGDYVKKNKYIIALRFVKGLARGYRECLLANPQQFVKKFPIGSDEWKDPRTSWTRKWKNGDPSQGPAFPGSTGLLVIVTDAKHFLPAIMTACDIATITMKLGEKITWKSILFDVGTMFVAESLGVNIAYHVLCDQPLFKGVKGQ